MMKNVQTKRLITACFVCMLLTTATWGSNNNITVSFDENGSGYINGDAILFGVDTPPEGIPGHATLFYVLPADEVVEGDVVIYEDVAQTTVSDILRFDIALPPRVFVYSDIEKGEALSELADTDIPDLWRGGAGGVVYLTEEGNENTWNGVHYTPAENGPGYVPGLNVTYVFTSDVPEPATICIFGLGALIFIRKKHA